MAYQSQWSKVIKPVIPTWALVTSRVKSLKYFFGLKLFIVPTCIELIKKVNKTATWAEKTRVSERIDTFVFLI